MRIDSIFLKNFRNYEEEKVCFSRDKVVIYGKNAQGKSNLLEGIYMFSLGRSERTNHDSDLIRFEQERARLELTFLAQERENQSVIELWRGKRKAVTYNEIPLRKISELMGKLRVVYFDPGYLEIVRGAPRVRRNNLDIFISQLRPNYFSFLAGMKKIVESKNALLKSQSPNLSMLEILNEKLADYAAVVIFYRAEYIGKLEEVARSVQSEISEGKENLKFRYFSCVGEECGAGEKEIRLALAKKLKDGCKRELENREALIGPHREDLIYSINDREVRVFGSQGQKKTVSLVQKLSEAELIFRETGEYPVLLLDDIMSELDESRQRYILNQLKDMQIFITCTDASLLDKLEQAQVLRVDNGTVREEQRD